MPNSAVKPAEAWAIDRWLAPPTEDPPQWTARALEKARSLCHVSAGSRSLGRTRRARVSGVGTEAHSSPHPGTMVGAGWGAVCSTLCLFPPQTSQMARPKESGGRPRTALGRGSVAPVTWSTARCAPRAAERPPASARHPDSREKSGNPSNVRTNPSHLANAEPGSP